MDEENYQTGMEILNVVDAYLDGTNIGIRTSRKINSLNESLKDIDHHGTKMVYLTAMSIEIAIDKGSSTDKIKVERGELASYLGD